MKGRWTMRCLLLLMMLVNISAYGANTKPPPNAKQAKRTLDGAKLYVEKTCAACHGKDANTPILPEYPKLAGQNAVYAEKQMQDIKSGKRNNGSAAAMKGIMHMVSANEMKALAKYLAKLK